MVKRGLKIIWDNEAKQAFRRIYVYIKRRESEEVAKKVRDRISLSVKSLIDFPEKFEKEPVLQEEQGIYRYKVIWSYKIIYEITDQAIYIVDIFHTSRDPSNIKPR